MPRLARIAIYPLKSFDPLPVNEAVVLPNGALQHDRQFALVDPTGKFINAKRTPAVHGLVLELDIDRAAILAPARIWPVVLPLLPGLFIPGFGWLTLRALADARSAEARSRNEAAARHQHLAAMCYELRTLLTGVIGQTELLKSSGPLAARQEAVWSRPVWSRPVWSRRAASVHYPTGLRPNRPR